MFEAITTSLWNLLAWQHLAYMMLGVIVGLIIGILPGLGGIAGMSLLIPFIYGMDTTSALAMLIGLVAVVPTGDTFTSVLMGIPGASGSQATVVDGYPLAKRGEAARALSAAFAGSALGGIFGAIVLTFFVVIAKPLILFFSTAELFMFAVLGLSIVGVLAGNSVARGLAACAIGMTFGAVGAAPATGEMRSTFGVSYLEDGIPLVIIGLGMFAFPEMAELVRRGTSVAGDNSEGKLGAGWMQGLKDTFTHWFVVLRSSIIGLIVGAIPGLGGGVVDWVAYGHVVQTSKDQSQYGKGDIRGVLASETSNNSLQGGALMPTLLFGIPGSGSMAVFLGGMFLLGIQPGPSMVTTELHLTYTIAWTLALASVIGAVLCFVLAVPLARLTFVPFTYVAPAMLVLICFAAFQARRELADLLLLFGFGMLGLFMRRFGWPRPAFLVGFVLAESAEGYLYQAVQFYGWGFLTRPGVIVIGVLALISILLALRGRVSEDGLVQKAGAAAGQGEETAAPPRDRRPQIIFTLLMIGVAAIALQQGLDQSFLGGVFPSGVAAVGLVFLLVLLAGLVFGKPDHPANYDQEAHTAAGTPSIWGPVFWFTLLFVLAALVGFVLAIAIFIPAFMMMRARKGPVLALVYMAACVGFMIAMGYFLTLDFPAGLLQKFVTLPWPLR